MSTRNAHGDIFERGAWTTFREPIESTWRGYVEGQRTLAEAAAKVLRSLHESRRPAAAEGGLVGFDLLSQREYRALLRDGASTLVMRVADPATGGLSESSGFRVGRAAARQ